MSAKAVQTLAVPPHPSDSGGLDLQVQIAPGATAPCGTDALVVFYKTIPSSDSDTLIGRVARLGLAQDRLALTAPPSTRAGLESWLPVGRG